jgi:hypothetical protein
MLPWRNLGAAVVFRCRRVGPPQQQGPRRRPSTERPRRSCDSHYV